MKPQLRRASATRVQPATRTSRTLPPSSGPQSHPLDSVQLQTACFSRGAFRSGVFGVDQSPCSHKRGATDVNVGINEHVIAQQLACLRQLAAHPAVHQAFVAAARRQVDERRDALQAEEDARADAARAHRAWDDDTVIDCDSLSASELMLMGCPNPYGDADATEGDRLLDQDCP